MLNVNELTSRMAKMSDPQLRQYAQLHKDDPYTLALAAAESKRRSQIRAAGQPQAARQPTVADQALAQMGAPAPMQQQVQQMQPRPQLPEQQGIGVLPAENVATMADGGIAGYGDSYADEYAAGGMVAFAGNEGSVVKDRMTPEEKAELERYRQENFDRLYGFKDWASGVKKDVVDWFNADRSNIPFESKNPMIKYGTPKYTGIMEYERPEAALTRERRERGAEPSTKLEQFQAPPPEAKEPGYAVKGKKKGEKSSYPAPIDEGDVYTGRDTYKNTPFNSKTDAGRNAAAKRPGAGTTTKDGKAGTTTTSTFTPAQDTDLNSELERLNFLSPGVGQYDVLKNKTEEGYANLQRQREEGRPKDKAYAGLEALLSKDEEKAKGKEARNFNMALINAGLAIAGGKSQYAIQNIAQGAQVGTKQYQEGLEKLEAAALERRKQSAMIEEARRAEARGDWKEKNEYAQKAFEAGLSSEKAKIDATMSIWGINQKAAVDLVNNQKTLVSLDRRTQYQQEQENTRAREQNISAEKIADKYANSRMGGVGLRGQITDDDIYRAYNQHELKDTFGDFKKQFPDFASYRNYILQQKSGQGGDPYADWGQLNVTNPKK